MHTINWFLDVFFSKSAGFIFLIIVYFFYHIVLGDRGVIEFLKTKELIALEGAKLTELLKKNEYLECVVSSLRVETIDLEVLEEFAKMQLGMLGKNETCFIIK